MAFTALVLLLLLGTGTCAMFTTETTAETTETTTETTTTDTTTTEMTVRKTIPPLTTPSFIIFKNTSSNGTQSSISSHATAFPTSDNATNFHFSNSSAGNSTANSTTAPAPGSTAIISHTNTTANSSHQLPPFGTNTTNNSSSVAPTSSTNSNGSTQVVPTGNTSVTPGTTAPRQTPTAVLGSSKGPKPSKAAALHPTAVQLLHRILLSFRILNRSFNESLRDPSSREYQSLQYTVLSMFQRVYGCASCPSRQSYKGCSELRFSQGSVVVQSTLMFGRSNGTVTSNAAEQQLRNSLDPNGFIMDLQLANIQSTAEVMSPAPVPVVPDWAIALLVLVCILLLMSILTCLLMTTCTCRRKSRGKLDLFSQKDSYHPMAEYPSYQSHGRYVSPHGKPSPYSQVAGSNGAGSGTFTYTNPASTSDNP